jgi:hypothetical protein
VKILALDLGKFNTGVLPFRLENSQVRVPLCRHRPKLSVDSLQEAQSRPSRHGSLRPLGLDQQQPSTDDADHVTKKIAENSGFATCKPRTS